MRAKRQIHFCSWLLRAMPHPVCKSTLCPHPRSFKWHSGAHKLQPTFVINRTQVPISSPAAVHMTSVDGRAARTSQQAKNVTWTKTRRWWFAKVQRRIASMNRWQLSFFSVSRLGPFLLFHPHFHIACGVTRVKLKLVIVRNWCMAYSFSASLIPHRVPLLHFYSQDASLHVSCNEGKVTRRLARE